MAVRRQAFGGGSGGGKRGSSYATSGAHSFTGLFDVPNAYTGSGGKVVVVKAAENGLEFTAESVVDRHDVKVSSADTDPQFLEDKLQAGTGLAPFTKSLLDNTLIINNILDPNISWGMPVKSTFDPTGGLPVLPSVGDRYISLATANGWYIDYIYEFDGLVWQGYPPVNGMAVKNKDIDKFVCWDSSYVAWVPMVNNIVEVDNATDEATAFANGAMIVIRTDLL